MIVSVGEGVVVGGVDSVGFVVIGGLVVTPGLVVAPGVVLMLSQRVASQPLSNRMIEDAYARSSASSTES